MMRDVESIPLQFNLTYLRAGESARLRFHDYDLRRNFPGGVNVMNGLWQAIAAIAREAKNNA